MRRKPSAYLWDILEAAAHVQTFVNDLTFEQFSADPMVRSAVERQFEIIGEALKQLSKVAPELGERIPDSPRIIAFRNILIHGYAILDQRIVWRVIHDHLPPLVEAAERLLKEADSDAAG